MLNSTNKCESEERPFTREIYNYLRKVDNEKLKEKEMLQNESGNVFVTKCKTNFISEPKPGDVKIFNQNIREYLRKSKVNNIVYSFGINTVYEVKDEDLNQSVLVDGRLNENPENFENLNNEENLINDVSWNGMDEIVNTTYQINTSQNIDFENVNHFVRLLGPYPDEPILAAFDKILCFLPSSMQDQ